MIARRYDQRNTYTSAPMEIGMAQEPFGEEKFEDYGKYLNLQCKQCAREQEAKVDGTEERVGVCRNASTAAKVKKGAIRAGAGKWSKTGGKKGGKGQEKGVKGDARVCWSCAKTGHIAAGRGVLPL